MYKNYIDTFNVKLFGKEILTFLIKILKDDDVNTILNGISEDSKEVLLVDQCSIEDFDVEKYLPINLPDIYPSDPFIYQITREIILLFLKGTCSAMSRKSFYLLEEEYENERISKFTEACRIAQESKLKWNNLEDDEKLLNIKKFLEVLGWRGILDLLGIRKTIGTVDILPPSREKLLESFNIIYPGSKQLTVGAKAFAKHCNRDVTIKWWGICTGSESNKSAQALKKIEEILNNASWINIHHLPHQMEIVEVRVEAGYGARWAVRENRFIGFVEPQKEEGWIDKYRH